MKLYFQESLSLLFQTWPFWLLKIGVYFAIGIVFFLIASLILFIAFKASGFVTWIIILIGLGALWGFFRLIRSYILYLIKAGHVAVIATLIQKGSLPPEEGMVSFGFKAVKSKFVTASVFFVIDQIISAIVKGISNFIYRLASWVPVGSVRKILQLVANIISVFLSYIDEAVLGYVLTSSEKDVWKTSRDGVVLYFKSWKPILATSAVVVLLNYLFSGLLFWILYIATAPITLILPSSFRDFAFLIALIVTFIIKSSFFDQWTLVWVMLAYNESIKGMSADSASASRLAELVPKFKELKAGGKTG